MKKEKININKVILNSLQDLRYLLLPLRKNNNLSGRFQIKFGMTPCYNAARGFTLIELLVVVLIIGILASVAVPQYQKAVEKSKAAQALTVLKSIAQAEQAYYLENGVYALSFDELSVDLNAFTGRVPWNKYVRIFKDTRSNADWSFQLSSEDEGKTLGISAGRISGPVAGGALVISNPARDSKWECREPKDTATSQYDFGFSWRTTGNFCKKLFHATNPVDKGLYASFDMP